MKVLENIKKGLTPHLIKLEKYAPDICIYTGVAGMVLGSAVAFYVGTQLKGVIDTGMADIHDMKEDLTVAVEREDEESIKAIEAELHNVRKQMTLSIFKGVLPIMAIEGGSAYLILKGKKAFNGRISTLTGLLQSQLTAVAANEGTKAAERDEHGKFTGEKKTGETSLEEMKRLTSRWYTKGCKQWSPHGDYNYCYLMGQQAYFTSLLQTRGYVFLNEVYDALGIEWTSAGQILGWVRRSDMDYVSFGFADDHEFCNGHTRDTLLTFNIQGVVYDMI